MHAFVVLSCVMRADCRVLLLLAVLLILVTFCVSQSQPDHSLPVVAIAHVTVINPGAGTVSPDQTVVITGVKITSVAPSSASPIPKGARVLDAHGQFLIPGLWDMHVHSAFGDWFPGGREVILPLFIANGVTGVRDMGGDLPVLFGWRKQIAVGELVG